MCCRSRVRFAVVGQWLQVHRYTRHRCAYTKPFRNFVVVATISYNALPRFCVVVVAVFTVHSSQFTVHKIVQTVRLRRHKGGGGRLTVYKSGALFVEISSASNSQKGKEQAPVYNLTNSNTTPKRRCEAERASNAHTRTGTQFPGVPA